MSFLPDRQAVGDQHPRLVLAPEGGAGGEVIAVARLTYPQAHIAPLWITSPISHCGSRSLAVVAPGQGVEAVLEANLGPDGSCLKLLIKIINKYGR